MSFLPVKFLTCRISVSLGASALFLTRSQGLLSLLQRPMKVSYRVFNKVTGIVEITRDITFDESNGSQVEQVNPSDVGDEAPCEAIRNMAIGEIRPQDPTQVQGDPSSPSQDEDPPQDPQNEQDQGGGQSVLREYG